MKSRTFCFNKKLFLNTLGRYSYLGVITLIVFFFVMPVILLMNLQNTSPGNRPHFLTDYFGSSYLLHNSLGMLLGGISALVLFSYLHQSRQVNFFHAQPITRPVLLTHRLLTGPVLYAAGYLINMLLSWLIAAVYGAGSFYPWGEVLLVFGLSLLAYCLIFIITALAAQLTGNLFAHIEISLFLLLIPSGIPLCLQLLMRTWLKTYQPGPVSELLLKTAPLAALYSDSWISLIYCISLVIVCTVLAFLLYNRRPLERAGHAVAYHAFGSFVRILGGILCGLFMGLFFRITGTGNEIFWTGLGIVLGILIWNMICQVQIHRTFRAALSGIKSLSAVLAACIVIVTIMSSGCFGYDNIRYTADKLKSITINLNYMEDMGHRYGENDNSITLTEPESKKAVLGLIDQLRTENDTGFSSSGLESAEVLTQENLDSKSEEYYVQWISLNCTYYPVFGIPTAHYYNNNVSEAFIDDLTAFRALPEYRRHHIIFDFTPESAQEYNWVLEIYREDNSRDYLSVTLPADKLASFVEAMQRDVLEAVRDPAELEMGMFYIEAKNRSGRGINALEDYGFFPFFSSYTRAAELLKELDILK